MTCMTALRNVTVLLGVGAATLAAQQNPPSRGADQESPIISVRIEWLDSTAAAFGIDTATVRARITSRLNAGSLATYSVDDDCPSCAVLIVRLGNPRILTNDHGRFLAQAQAVLLSPSTGSRSHERTEVWRSAGLAHSYSRLGSAAEALPALAEDATTEFLLGEGWRGIVRQSAPPR
jgi:hypothetical protein